MLTECISYDLAHCWQKTTTRLKCQRWFSRKFNTLQNFLQFSYFSFLSFLAAEFYHFVWFVSDLFFLTSYKCFLPIHMYNNVNMFSFSLPLLILNSSLQQLMANIENSKPRKVNKPNQMLSLAAATRGLLLWTLWEGGGYDECFSFRLIVPLFNTFSGN